MIDALIAGRMYGNAERNLGKSGSTYVLCKVKVLSDDGDGYLCNVIAFNEKLCQQLLQLDDGASVCLSGALTPKVWVDKQGMARPALDLVAHRWLSLNEPSNQ